MPLSGGLTLAGAGLNVIAGGAKSIFGANELKKTKQELAALHMPGYKIQDEYFQNRNIAGSLAQGGLTQGAKDYYTEEAGRGLGAGISATLQGGGGVNDISRLLDTYNRGIKNVAAEDAEKQMGNIKNYTDTLKDLAGQKTMQWAINEYQPYQNKLKELTQRRAAAYQNLFGGIGDVASSLGGAGTALQNVGLGNNGRQSTIDTMAQDRDISSAGENIRLANINPAQGYSPEIAIKNLIPQ